MGCPVDRTFVVGSPMREVLNAHRSKIEASDALERFDLERNGYILLSAHREENIDNERNFAEMVAAVNSLAEEYNMPILYSMHPRSKSRIEQRGAKLHPLVRAHKPFGFCDYVHLQCNAFCVVSDSGTLAEESAILGFPAVSLRTSTERPEAVDAGVFTLGNLSAEDVIQSVETETALVGKSAIVPNYYDCATSVKIMKLIQSYVSYVNRQVWR